MAVTGVEASPPGRLAPAIRDPSGQVWRAGPALLASAAMLLAAACTAGSEPAAGGASPPAVTPPPAVQVDTPTGAPLPSNAQQYAEAAVAAWAAPDLLQLDRLTTPEVNEQIISLPGPPDQGWTFIRCAETEPAASTCTFHNRDGDHLALVVSHRLLGEPRGVRTATFQPTTFPDRPLAYAREFVEGWLAGNPPRMSQLAVADAVAALGQLPASGTPAYELTGSDDQGTTVEVSLTPDDIDATPDPSDVAGVEFQLRIGTARLGEPLAVRQLTLPGPGS